MASSLTSALSSMEVMLDALMQRGIGRPEEQKSKEEEPPALPTRPTGRGRLPSLQRPGAAAPWIHRAPLPSPLPPQQEEDEEEKCLVNLELEERVVKAEEAVKQKEEEMKQKEELIATLRQHVEHYESRLWECEVRMKSVEELQKQITSLQMAQTAGGRRGASMTTSQHRQESSRGNLPPSQSSVRRQQRGCEPTIVVVNESYSEVNQLAKEFKKQSEAFEHNARALVEAKPSPSSAKSVDELKMLKRQFTSWKKEYEARLKKTKAELKKLVHAEKKSHGNSQSHQRRCGWWKIKAPKGRAPKCCSFKLPCPKSCCCCFRRCC